eukprot:CAMPEP_0177763228 /NCGR_PEP_ID=MMETSP0491_2-20121128/6760_1 /TAXON_ID=63592 /ORGANISM="Tetraselmis chuii, Strain PLY429" /LENGTH=588 /DNA_ID=CAMNT_0019279323 /DNA_START=84 /DNA_END=1850 /DNA_ORIENTATION=+
MAPTESKYDAQDAEIKGEKSAPTTSNSEVDLRYSVNDVPPWYFCILLGFQHYLTMLGSTVLIPLLLVPAMGGSINETAKVINSMFFVSGLNTLVQTTLGDRLPIIQGGSFSYLPPAFAIIAQIQASGNFASDYERFEATMNALQGALICAAFVQMFLGYTGLMAFLLRFVSPITTASVVSLVGLSLYTVGWSGVGQCFELGVVQIALVIIFSQYLSRVEVPMGKLGKMRLFQLFPVVLAIVVCWIYAVIMTEAGVYDSDPTSACRTDQTDVLDAAPWFYFPHPFQWGHPTFDAGYFFAMLAGTLASIFESIGDYYAVAKLSGAPTPPRQILSRGIGAEGFGTLVSALWGTGNGTTSYSENIGAIGITGVGSRRAVQAGAGIFLVFGVFGKFGALFASMPFPMVSGIFCCTLGLIAAVGVSQLQHTNQNSSRNLFIFGFAVFNALSLQYYFNNYQAANGSLPIQSSSLIVNDIFNTLFSTPPFMGMVFALFLDCTVPGSQEERGLTAWKGETGEGESDDIWAKQIIWDTYALPWGLQGVCNGVRNALFAKCGCGKQIATAPPSALSSPESSPAMTSDPEDGSTTIGVSA